MVWLEGQLAAVCKGLSVTSEAVAGTVSHHWATLFYAMLWFGILMLVNKPVVGLHLISASSLLFEPSRYWPF